MARLGDLASIAGLFVSVIGFIVTVIGVWRAKAAAEEAAAAARAARDQIGRQVTIADFSAAVSTMNEIRRLHRAQAWSVLPDRYAALRQMLISARATAPALTEPQQASIQEAIQHITAIERLVERDLASGRVPTGVARFNSILSEQMDSLGEILALLTHDRRRADG